MDIGEPRAEELEDLAVLLDAYRIFYDQPGDYKAALIFLQNRLKNKGSVIFVARANDSIIGFTQLYPSFSSVSLQGLFILNDLYVLPEYRQQGVGKALLLRAQEYCIELGYKGLALETAVDNPAQKLYEQLGWKQDAGVFHYFWTADIP